jgi:hypothetical protein
MPESPVKHLARLKVQHAMWSIGHSEEFGFEAARGDVRLWASSLTEMEMLLQAADHPRVRKTAT